MARQSSNPRLLIPVGPPGHLVSSASTSNEDLNRSDRCDSQPIPIRSEASPYYSQQLEKLVLSASASDVMDFLTRTTGGVEGSYCRNMILNASKPPV